MHSMSVVLPAPFGPMRPTISPSRTARSTSSRAARPPKWTVTPRQSRMTGASLRSEAIDESGRDHLVLVVRLRFEHGHLLDAVHGVRATRERDRPGDEIAVVVEGRDRFLEPLTGEIRTRVGQRALEERHDLIAGSSARTV